MVPDDSLCCDLSHGLAVSGGDIDDAVLQDVEDRGDTSCQIQILDAVGPSGPEARDVGGVPGDPVEIIECDRATKILGDGGQMERCVGGSSDGHVHADGVEEGLLTDDIARFDVLLSELHDPPTGLPCDGELPVVIGEGGCTAGET